MYTYLCKHTCTRTRMRVCMQTRTNTSVRVILREVSQQSFIAKRLWIFKLVDFQHAPT